MSVNKLIKIIFFFLNGNFISMDANGQGLALLGDLKNVRPELKPN
jgi:hypothetical protein